MVSEKQRLKRKEIRKKAKFSSLLGKTNARKEKMENYKKEKARKKLNEQEL